MLNLSDGILSRFSHPKLYKAAWARQRILVHGVAEGSQSPSRERQFDGKGAQWPPFAISSWQSCIHMGRSRSQEGKRFCARMFLTARPHASFGVQTLSYVARHLYPEASLIIGPKRSNASLYIGTPLSLPPTPCEGDRSIPIDICQSYPSTVWRWGWASCEVIEEDRAILRKGHTHILSKAEVITGEEKSTSF